MTKAGKCWRKIEQLARNRKAWWTFADGLNSSWREKAIRK
jgi:hypothetical protein